MARIRTLKPEFWQDEKLSRLEPLTRLVFVALISMADDGGRLVDNLKLIDGFVFPETDDSSAEALTTLAKLSRIVRYTSASGQRLIQITNWERHQKVDHPNKYTLPAPTDDDIARTPVSGSSRGPRETVAKGSRGVPDTTYDLRPTTNDLVANATNGARRKRAADAPVGPPDWVNQAVEIYAEHIGVVPHGKAGKLLKPVVAKDGWETVKPVLECFCDLAPYEEYLTRMEAGTLRPGEEKVKRLGYQTSLAAFVERYTHWKSYLQVGS